GSDGSGLDEAHLKSDDPSDFAAPVRSPVASAATAMTPALSLVGQDRQNSHEHNESAFAPIATVERTLRDVSEVPQPAVSNRSKAGPYSITSSASASSDGGYSRPSDFAVLRLTTSSLLKNLNSSAFVLRFSSSYKRSVRFGSECSRLVATLSL